MGFSIQWDELYRSNAHLSVWPWSDVVSYVHRYAKPSAGYARVLEFGCGAGANIPLFLGLKADYFAIEGSPAIVDTLRATYPQLSDRIAVGDFTQSVPFDAPFDLVLDRASLIHNTNDGIAAGLRLAYAALRPGGKMIGVDWFSDRHGAAALGRAVDSHTRADLPATSSLAGTGNVHFCDQAHLLALLGEAGFAVERLEHKQYDVAVPATGERVAVWNFVAAKPD